MDPVDRDTFYNEVLNVGSLPRYEEVELNSFSRGYLLKRNISTTISVLMVGGGVTAAALFSREVHPFLPYVIPVLVVIFTWSYVSNFFWYKKSGYALREKDIIYKRGFLYERTTIVPFNRVQHVSTNRDLFDKVLNLSTLNVFTAGGSGSDVALPGLKPATANSLKESLAARMSSHA